MEEFANGALRSEVKPRYQDISLSLIKRGAQAMSEGHEKYELHLAPGYKNYKQGDTEFALAALDHAIEHLLEFKEQCIDSLLGVEDPFAGEDHLGHLVANLNMIDFYQSKGLFTPQEQAVIELTSQEPELALLEDEPKETLSVRIQKALGLSK